MHRGNSRPISVTSFKCWRRPSCTGYVRPRAFCECLPIHCTNAISLAEQSEEEDPGSPDLEGLDLEDLERCAQELALPYLRVAALMEHYFFDRVLPVITEEHLEFPMLLSYLGLNGERRQELSVCDGLNWFTEKSSSVEDNAITEIEVWCRNLHPLAAKSATVAKQLLLVNILWKQPRLLQVPRNYDAIFQVRTSTSWPTSQKTSYLMRLLLQFYHKRQCGKCGNVPKDPTVCLMCGTMVCLKEHCCKAPTAESPGEKRRCAESCRGSLLTVLLTPSQACVRLSVTRRTAAAAPASSWPSTRPPSWSSGARERASGALST